MPIISFRRLNIKLLPRGRNRAIRRLMTRPVASPALSGTVYPSGSFTLGFVPRKKKSDKEDRYSQDSESWRCSEELRFNSDTGLVRTYHYAQGRTRARFIEPSYLGKARAVRGSKGLTNYGKRYVRESCYILESQYGVKKLGFYTLTVPACGVDEAWDIAIQWTSIYKYFFKLLRNEIASKVDREFLYVGVTENQSKRSSRLGSPYYHLHFVMPCYYPNTTNFLISSHRLRQLWRQALINYVPSLSKACFKASADSQVLRRSASGYLSKYFSKGCQQDEAVALCHPPSWYFSSRSLKNAYKKACKRLSSDLCSYIVSSLSDTTIVEFWDYVTSYSEYCGREVVRGYYGQITASACITIYEAEV